MNKFLQTCLIVPLLSATLAAAASAAPPDVPSTHWAAKSVKRVTAKKIMTSEPDGKFHGDKPVTRYELAAALDRFVQYIEAGRKPLHTTSQSTKGLGPKASAAARHLVAQGFLPINSPIVRGKGTEVVTANQLSDALAQVTIRLSDRSLPPTTH